MPPVRRVVRNPLVDRAPPCVVDVDQAALQMSLAALGALEIRQVRRTTQEALFNSLVQQHHYLGYRAARWGASEVPGLRRCTTGCVYGVEFGATPPGQSGSVHWLGRAGTVGQRTAAGLRHALSGLALGQGAAPGVASAGPYCEEAVSGLAAPVWASDLLPGDLRRSAALLGALSSRTKLRQPSAKILDQRVAQQVLDRTVGLLGRGVLAAPGGHPEVQPVGRAVATAGKQFSDLCSA